MELSYVIEGENLYKKYRGFQLNVPKLQVPKGFATALIGENGAGKTTLLNILAGIRPDYKGQLRYFMKYSDKDREENPKVKEAIGYTGPGDYYLPHWKIRQVEEISTLLYEGFSAERFRQWCMDLNIIKDQQDRGKKVSALSDGNRMKLMIAGVLARDTSLLLMDEPASPLDPLMRDRLCEMIRNYLCEEEGQRSVLFSTHNIADMENVTDYAIIMAGGTIVESGFVEDLKEKYVFIKGEPEDTQKAEKVLYTMSAGKYGYEGICLAEKLDQLAGCDIQAQTPSLSQISVAVMKHFSNRRG